MKSKRTMACLTAILLIAFGARAQSRENVPERNLFTELMSIDEEVRKEFEKAWRVSTCGTKNVEGLVLLYRMRDGSIAARSQGNSNEYKRFSFAWSPTIIAVVHTHPNSEAPAPHGADLDLANRFQIPVFTITSRGMFGYDPATRKITRIQNNLDWLNPALSPVVAVKR
jgi:hypothetical protein